MIGIACPPRPVQGLKDPQQIVRNRLVHQVCVVGSQSLAEAGCDLRRQGWLGLRFTGHFVKPWQLAEPRLRTFRP